MAGIAVVLDHTTATALYDPKDAFSDAVAAFYVQASAGLGTLYAPVLSMTAGGRPSLTSLGETPRRDQLAWVDERAGEPPA